jgi:4-hydroxy-tetrahydrodipicolinate reductase
MVNSEALRVAVAGAGGRMGQMLIGAIAAAPDLVLSGALDVAAAPGVGRDAGAPLGRETGVRVTSDVEQGIGGARVLIDFTRPAGTLRHVAACRRHGIAAVIGTTGLSESERQELRAASADVPIVLAPNMSVGINLMLGLVEIAAKRLATGYDVEILEMHHRHKVDAPSGTALRLGEVVASALGRDLAKCAVYGREGVTGERDPSTIGFATLRGGDVVGDHTVIFAGDGERLEIAHKASSRATFAQGALRAARFVATRDSGWFDMRDVLGLR